MAEPETSKNEEPMDDQVVKDGQTEEGEASATVEVSDETAAAAADVSEVTDDIEELRQVNENLQLKLEENLDKVLRVQAEMENLRKRTLRDIENAHKYALDKFIKELLPVIDSMELGITASGDEVEELDSFIEGMDLTLKKFLDTLQKFGVEVIDPLQEKFNPEKHQAVTMQEAEGTESGSVTAVMQKGYELNGRLVRPAMVIVAK